MMRTNGPIECRTLRTCLLVLMLSCFLHGVALAAPVSHYERGPLNDRVIVFVHGIFGDASGTWTSSGGAYWPRLLLSDRAFEDSDVYVANYDTPLHGDTMTVDEVVSSLNSVLTSDGVFAKHREVVFVCHSLGGIVVQQLLLTFRDHADQVPFIYFFSVPSEGSKIATLGRFFSSDPLLSALFGGDENGYLLTLETQWKAAHFKLRRYCAYEKKPLKGSVLVVDRLSATRNCDDPAIPIDEDHFGIVKPNDARHPSYLALRNAVVAHPVLPIPGKSPLSESAKPEAPKKLFPSSPPMFSETHDKFNVSAGSISTTLANGRSTCLISLGPERICVIKAYVEKGSFFVDAVLFRGAGRGFVEVKKNVLSKDIPEWDRCFDNTALEVVDEQLTPMFQVIYTTPSDIVIYGIFRVESGWAVALAPDGAEVIAPSNKPWNIPSGYRVNRIFEYPSRISRCEEINVSR